VSDISKILDIPILCPLYWLHMGGGVVWWGVHEGGEEKKYVEALIAGCCIAEQVVMEGGLCHGCSKISFLWCSLGNSG
jgi:hypothetical protein